MITSNIKESPIKGLIGLGGGATGLLQVGAALTDVYWWNIANNTGNVSCKAVAVDNDGNIYTAGAVTGYAVGNICKFDKEGDMKWSYKGDYWHGEGFYENIAVDNDGQEYGLCGSVGSLRIGKN